MSEEALARDTEQSDREYIAQRQEREKRKRMGEDKQSTGIGSPEWFSRESAPLPDFGVDCSLENDPQYKR